MFIFLLKRRQQKVKEKLLLGTFQKKSNNKIIRNKTFSFTVFQFLRREIKLESEQES